MDKTTLGPTGMSTSEAGREGAERGAELPRPAPLITRLVARMLDFIILFLIFDRFTGPIREPFARFVFNLFLRSLRIRVFLIDAYVLNVGFLLFTGFLMVSCIYLLCNCWGLARLGQSLGKRMARIRIMPEDRSCPSASLGFGRLFLRELLFLFFVTLLFISWYAEPRSEMGIYGRLAVVVLLIDVLPGLSGSRRCVHDRLAGTWVCDLKLAETLPSPSPPNRRYDGAYYSGLYREYMGKLAEDGTGNSDKESA